MRLTAFGFAGHSTGFVRNQESPRRSMLKPPPGPDTSSSRMSAASGPSTRRLASSVECSIRQSRSK